MFARFTLTENFLYFLCPHYVLVVMPNRRNQHIWIYIVFVRFYIVSYFNNEIWIILVSNGWGFCATVYQIFTLFYCKRFYITYTRLCKYVYVYVCGYTRVSVCIHVCMCIWDTDMRIYEFVSLSACVCRFICHFNSSSVSLYIICIIHCVITLLCTWCCTFVTVHPLTLTKMINWTELNKIFQPCIGYVYESTGEF